MPRGAPLADLIVEGQIVDEPVAAFEDRDALEVRTLDLTEVASILRIAPRFVGAAGTGTRCLGEKDCGVYLHDLYDGPTDSHRCNRLVGDIRHDSLQERGRCILFWPDGRPPAKTVGTRHSIRGLH